MLANMRKRRMRNREALTAAQNTRRKLKPTPVTPASSDLGGESSDAAAARMTRDFMKSIRGKPKKGLRSPMK